MIIDATKINYFTDLYQLPNESPKKKTSSESDQEDVGIIVDASSTGKNKKIEIEELVPTMEEGPSYGQKQ